VQVVALLSLIYLITPVGISLGQVPFYQGKTITLVRGSTPGGIGEMRVRALMPYLKKHIPGQPTILIEFMDGGGGRKAANHVFSRSDGLTVGSTPSGILASAILGESGVMYDLDKFIFLGSSESESHYSFLTRREAGWDSLEKLRSTTGVRIGSHAVGHPIYLTGRFFAYFLSLKSPKFIPSYSSPEQDVAIARGEIDARSEVFSFYHEKTPRVGREGNGASPRCYRGTEGKKDSPIYPSSGYRNIRQNGKGAKPCRYVPTAARRWLTLFEASKVPVRSCGTSDSENNRGSRVWEEKSNRH
jgi:hypothetical protein